MTQPHKTDDKTGQQQQQGSINDPSRRDQRPQTMPGSHGVESPGQGELARSKPGEEQGRPRNGMDRQDENSDDQQGNGIDRPGDASASKRDAGSKPGYNPGQRQDRSNQDS